MKTEAAKFPVFLYNVFERHTIKHGIAVREGIRGEEVRREISLAILMAQPKDASIVSAIPCAGAIPTPEELIAYCVSRL